MPLLGKTKQDLVTEFRSGEILEAARAVFAEKGFTRATMDDVAEAAGLAKGTLYLYFPSKREMFLATLRNGIEELHEETRQRVAEASTVEAKIHAFLRTRIEYFEANRDYFRIYYSEFSNLLVHPLHVQVEFRDLYMRQAGMLESVLEEALEQRAIRDVRPRATALMIYDMTRGLIAQRLLGWSNGDVREDIEFLFSMIWKGIARE